MIEQPNTFNGLKVYVSDMVDEFTPILELKPTIEVTDSFRKEFNQYLLDTFGSTKTILLVGNNIIVHPNTYRSLRKEVTHDTNK